MISAVSLFLCVLAALLAGIIDSVAGGGGILTIPALLLAGVAPHNALACNKASACCGTLTALGTFAKNGLVLWRLALVGIGFSLLGAYYGAKLTIIFDSDTLGKILVALLPVALILGMIPQKDKEHQEIKLNGLRFYLLAPLSCFIIGLYDGFFGPGTGTFCLLALHIVVGIPLLEASATTKVFNFASNISAVVVFFVHGYIIWSIALPMALASILGNWLGSRLAIKKGSHIVKKGLLISMVLLFVSLLYKYFG